MRLSVTFEDTRGAPKAGGPVMVGWFLADQKGGIVFYPPERVRHAELNRAHAKSASRCPAVINMESRYFLIRSPYDIHIGFTRDKDGKPALRNLAGTMSGIRGSKLGEKLHVTSEVEWRHEGIPTIQLALPYCFITDEPVYVSQLSPFMHYSKEPLPGTIFGGRFPINVWPRPLMWAFEWHEPDKPIKINRGDPLFYVGFETPSPERPIGMVEAELTDELRDYMELISGAVNYVNQTFSLFEEAEKRRPDSLLTPKRRSRADIE